MTAAAFLRVGARQLVAYPSLARQGGYLALTLIAAVALAWLSSAAAGVAPQIIAEYSMSFRFYVAVAIVAIAVGATGALAAGLADRYGRVTIVVIGLLSSSLLVLFALPNAGNKYVYLLLTALTGVVEGATGVALPAMVRDFSPQVRRATAMGLWLWGPVLGSLIVTAVATHTLDSHPNWRFQFRVAGMAGLVVTGAAAIWLRELSPDLRNQIVVRGRDHQLAQVQAVPPDATTQQEQRSILGLEVLGSAFAISLYLMFYYVLVGFFVVYLVTTFGYSGSRANGLANAYWAASAISILAAGVLSDALHIRKPLMVAGAVISAAGSALMAVFSTRTATGYGVFLAIVLLAAVGNGLTVAPWMAAYSETIEQRNPAAIAAGFAAWSALNKVVVTAVLIGFMFTVTAPSVLLDKSAQVQELAIQHPAAVQALVAGQSVPPGDPIATPDLAKLRADLFDIAHAKTHGPGEWQRWWWICMAGQLLFIPFIGLMAGRWRPQTARADLRSHDVQVAAALQKLDQKA